MKFAIIVSYEPNIEHINHLCRTIADQAFNIVIVDNSEDSKITELNSIDNCYIITNEKNMGIAFAQNIGVKFAETKGAKIIVFFDQDSIISDDMLFKLEEALYKSKNSIVCPVSLERTTNTEYPSHRVNKFGMMKDMYSRCSKEYVEVDIAISSGMTTYVETFNKIGEFDEDFFIDFVDVEWCMRSKKFGIVVYIVPDAIMYHSIGDNAVKVGPVNITKHSPIRTYYKVRNSFLLLRKNMSFLFALRQIMPALIHNFLLSITVVDKKLYFKYYIKGFWHGIKGVKGKLIEK